MKAEAGMTNVRTTPTRTRNHHAFDHGLWVGGWMGGRRNGRVGGRRGEVKPKVL